MTKTFEPTNVVMYSREFLRSIGAYADEIASREGIVDRVETIAKRQFVYVWWSDNDEQPMPVYSGNLILKSERHLERV